MKNFNKDYCDNIRNLLENFSVKAKYSVVKVSRDFYSLKISLVSDGSFTKAEISVMYENWV